MHTIVRYIIYSKVYVLNLIRFHRNEHFYLNLVHDYLFVYNVYDVTSTKSLLLICCLRTFTELWISLKDSENTVLFFYMQLSIHSKFISQLYNRKFFHILNQSTTYKQKRITILCAFFFKYSQCAYIFQFRKLIFQHLIVNPERQTSSIKMYCV